MASMHFEQVRNYYERLVFEAVLARANADRQNKYSDELLADVACVALNRLPPRYMRHEVDLVFYLTGDEREAMELALDAALDFAFDFVLRRHADQKTE